MKDILDKLDNIITEGQLGDMANRVEQDHEVQMARADLYKLAKYSIQLHDMLKGISEEQGLEGWVQAKITKAADYIGSVKHHLEYQQEPEAQDDAMDSIAFDLATEDKVVKKDDPIGDLIDNDFKVKKDIPNSTSGGAPAPDGKGGIDPDVSEPITRGFPGQKMVPAKPKSSKVTKESKVLESKFSDWSTT